MNNYKLTHIKNYEDAIGAPIKIISGFYEGKTGFIKNIYKPINGSYPIVVEICLPKAIIHKYMDGNTFEDAILYLSDFWDSSFAINIKLQDGKKYVTMNGDIVTMHTNKYGNGFHVNNSEITHDEKNQSIECYESNGFAYHYDCGCNILKEYTEK
jgi:hypothetical protein